MFAIMDNVLSKSSLKLKKLQLMNILIKVDFLNLNLETITCMFPYFQYLGVSYKTKYLKVTMIDKQL